MPDKIRLLDDRLALLDFANLAGKDCAEVGVARGHFASEILGRGPRKLFLIDPWIAQAKTTYPDDHANVRQEDFESIYQEVRAAFRDANVEIIREFSLFAASRFQSQSLDFVYLDAIHTFESCFSDIVTWFPKVKDGGWLCGHDYTGNYPGVRAAVEAFTVISGQELTVLTGEAWVSWGIKIDSSRRPQ